jgi:hypothetical protein
MNQQMPRTPFSTGLSGSARETEIRLRNIFSGPKKRPPLPFLILMFAIAIFCGNLVSCRQRPPEPSLLMETQYYDSYGNYVEIPVLALPAGQENEAVEAINTALNDLRGEYAQLDSRTGTDAWENQCLFYPSTTDRYLNLLFFRSRFTTDLNTGHVFSLVYDRKEGTLVSAGDALALAGLNEKALLDQVTEQMEPEMNPEGQGYQIALHRLTLEGFRIKADGQPVFYLTGRMDDVDDAVLDAVSGADQLFIWEDRAVTVYDQYSLNAPLVPAEETDKLDPPLWNQWYFAGEEPAGGFVDKSALEPVYTYVPGENPYGNNFFAVLLEQYTQYQDKWNVFCAWEQTDTDKAGDLRVTPTYLGEIPWDGDAYAAAYQICYTFYINGPQGLEWHANFEEIVLCRSAQDGEFTGLLARMDYEDRMHWMTAEEIISHAVGTAPTKTA